MTKPATITQALVDALNDQFSVTSAFTVIPGRRFDKVTQTSTEFGPGASQRFVFLFVERETGGVYKAAGWSAPAKNERFRVDTPESIDALVKRAIGKNSRPSSGFLYQR